MSPLKQDDETAKESITPDFLQGIEPISPEEEKDMEDRAYSGAAEDIADNAGLSSEQLADAESAGATPEASEPEKSEQAATPDSEIPYRDEGKKKSLRGRLSLRKKLIGGGAVGGTIGVIFAIFTVLQGPMQMVHFSQLLQRFHFFNDSQLMDNRAGKIIKWARTRNATERRHMGYFGNKIADHYDTKFKKLGMEAQYNRAGRLSAIEIDTTTEAGKQAHSKMLAAGADVTDVEGSPGKIRVELDGASPKLRRAAISGMVDSAGLSKVSSIMAARLGKVRAAVDFHPLKNIARSVDERIYLKYAERVNKEQQKRINGGAEDLPKAPGEPEKDSDADKALKEAAGEAADATTPDAKAGALQGKLKSGAVLGIPLVCGLYKIGESIPAIKHTKVVLPLIRTGMDIITMGAQVMSGQGFNIDELGVLSQNFTDKETGSNFAAAADIQAELGNEPTGPKMPINVNTDQPEFFRQLSGKIESIPLNAGSTVCNAITSTAGGLILDTAMAAFQAAGPVSFAVSFIGDQLAGIAVGSFVGDVIDSLVVGVKQGAKGALLGSYSNYGARLSANDDAISHGGAELTQAQSTALKAERNKLLRDKLQQKSMYARYLDLTEPDSIASKSLFNNPNIVKPQATIASIARAPFSSFGSAFRNIIPKASAEVNYDYGFPEYGFSLDELNDDSNKYDDPFENAAWVEEGDRLSVLNDKYGGPCFGLTIDPATGAIKSDNDVKRYDEIDPKCKDRSNVELTKYRYYLADMTATKSLTCFEGIDEQSCSELGFGNTSGSSSSPNTATDTAVVGNTSDVPCAAGTIDAGVADGYSGGQKYLIRLCEVTGFTSNSTEDVNGIIRVNSTGSAQWLQLYQQAKSAGINLTANSSFRTMVKQQYLYNCMVTGSCNNGNLAAKPGYSNHQIGFAVDIDIAAGKDPSLTTCQSSPNSYPVYQWLVGNAPALGIDAKVSSECWHWSIGGK